MSDQTPKTQKKGDDPRRVAANNPTADRFIGFELLGRYRIVELIGAGGWGNVYRGEHLNLGTRVAIKVIHRHLSQDEASLKRLEQEARVLSRLESPYIVRILDYAIAPFPFIVMEYFDGIPLSQWLKDNGPLEYATAIELFMQICDGMSNAMEAGLVHRDLKPGNVMLKAEEGQVSSKILDFGIVRLIDDSAAQERLTSTGEILGSPPYMSPEQWAGRADHRSDIYSLGCIMYEALTGKSAFSAQYGIDYLQLHASDYPARMRDVASGGKFPDSLENVVFRCMQKSAEARYQTSAALKADLLQVKAGRKVSICVPEDKKLPGKKATLLARAMIAIVILAGSLTVWFAREPLFAFFCQRFNDEADRERSLGKTDETIASCRTSLMLAQLLPRQDTRKLHAMRMLASALKERKQWLESAALDKQVDELMGWGNWTEFRRLLQQCYAERDRTTPDLSAAEKYARQSMSEASARAGVHSMAYSDALELYCATLRQKGAFREALHYQKQALDIAQDLLEANDPIMAKRLNNLAIVLAALNKNADAERAYRQAIAIELRRGSALELSNYYNNLALTFLDQNKRDEAFVYFQKSLEICLRVKRKNALPILNKLSKMYAEENQPDRAREYSARYNALQKELQSGKSEDAMGLSPHPF
jgi:tRNA A-37 threonylcarbamoyl transferase component Bud32/tetratricopeptide (TPR) repeat protein